MADDRHYVPGDFYRICERTGFKVRAGRTAKEWTGRLIRKESWEPRQPQDFVRGVVDNQTVPEPRPRQIDVVIGPLQTTISANVQAGANVVPVASSVRFQAGDSLGVMLDNGIVFYVILTTPPGFGPGFGPGFASGLVLANPLPFKASAGNLVVDFSANALADIG